MNKQVSHAGAAENVIVRGKDPNTPFWAWWQRRVQKCQSITGIGCKAGHFWNTWDHERGNLNESGQKLGFFVREKRQGLGLFFCWKCPRLHARHKGAAQEPNPDSVATWRKQADGLERGVHVRWDCLAREMAGYRFCCHGEFCCASQKDGIFSGREVGCSPCSLGFGLAWQKVVGGVFCTCFGGQQDLRQGPLILPELYVFWIKTPFLLSKPLTSQFARESGQQDLLFSYALSYKC